MFNPSNTIYLTKPDVLRALGRDMLTIARYLCSCACLYDPNLWTQSTTETDQTTRPETTHHLSSAAEAQPSYRTVNSVSPSTRHEATATATTTNVSEVQHHKAPIETLTECTNPLHAPVTLPPAPVVIHIQDDNGGNSANTLCSPVSSSSSDDEVGSARIRLAEVEDPAVSGDPNEPWQVL